MLGNLFCQRQLGELCPKFVELRQASPASLTACRGYGVLSRFRGHAACKGFVREWRGALAEWGARE